MQFCAYTMMIFVWLPGQGHLQGVVVVVEKPCNFSNFKPPSKQSNAIFLAKFSTKHNKSSYSRASWTVCEHEQNKDGQKNMSSCKVWGNGEWGMAPDCQLAACNDSLNLL